MEELARAQLQLCPVFFLLNSSSEMFQCHFKHLLFSIIHCKDRTCLRWFSLLSCRGTYSWLSCPLIVLPCLFFLPSALNLPPLLSNTVIYRNINARPNLAGTKQGDSWLNGFFLQCLNVPKDLEG